MKHKKYIRRIWKAIHDMETRGMIDTPPKFAAIEDLKISNTELEKAFKQEIKKDS